MNSQTLNMHVCFHILVLGGSCSVGGDADASHCSPHTPFQVINAKYINSIVTFLVSTQACSLPCWPVHGRAKRLELLILNEMMKRLRVAVWTRQSATGWAQTSAAAALVSRPGTCVMKAGA